jgi:DnaJ-class molecular chaperone with C-terminal Zn finger domain
LSDPEKRRKYDQYGPDFEKHEQYSASPFDDIFEYNLSHLSQCLASLEVAVEEIKKEKVQSSK